ALKLEGLYRHASTHAAGVVIGDRPLDQLIPLYRDPRSDMPVTGFSMKWTELAGLVKFDFLGLKTLTVLSRTVDFIKEQGEEIDLEAIPLDDARTFELISKGDTAGVFQLEGSGMRAYLKSLKPDTFEDIIAMVALYRPGPMDNIPVYINRKHGKEQVESLHEWLEPVLEETYGVIIYQEQVMEIAKILAGYSLGEADLLRRAMGKKIKSEMDAQQKRFTDGAREKGVSEAKASFIFNLVAKFAGYGFNKSHAAAYALVAYQTAYMKANHPVEFMAASMTLDMQNTDKLSGYKEELRRLDIPLLPPDINASGVEFAVERPDAEDSAGSIRYALAAIKNVGEGAMAGLVDERRQNGPFKDLTDLADRLDTHAVNKRQMENLVRAGALDALEGNRRRLYEGLETVLRHAAAVAEERASNQIGLFGEAAMPAAMENLPDLPDWPKMDRMREEFDAIGFHLSGHPLEVFGKSLERLGVRPVAEVKAGIQAQGRGSAATLAGMIQKHRVRISSRGSRYAFVTCSDTSGEFEITVFSEVLSEAREILEDGNSILIKAAAQLEDDDVRFVAHSIEPLAEATQGTSRGLKVRLGSAESLSALRDMLAREGRGKGRVVLVCALDGGGEADVTLPQTFAISPTVIGTVQQIPGVLAAEEI
ncbi:MAG: DNA polymerase III subunit alpha, partial [Rhodospirillales bacterium]|nr:DNA polymerase III subunit alpha [Rhodospirillales bacterium]